MFCVPCSKFSFKFLILVTLSKKCEFMALSTKEGNLCRCLDSDEARNMSSSGIAHVHCSCLRCKGKAVYPMTAWKHLQRKSLARKETLDEQLQIPSGTYELGQLS